MTAAEYVIKDRQMGKVFLSPVTSLRRDAGSALLAMSRVVQKTIAAGGVTLLMAGRPSGFTLVAAAIVHDLAATALDHVES